MKRVYWIICLLLYSAGLAAQPVKERLAKAMELLQQDAQMTHALAGLSVVNAITGEKIIEINAQTGLAPASCQKLFTSAAAFEILGPAYRYKTILGIDGTINDGKLKGDLVLIGSGDPSLGSWRFDSTKEAYVLAFWQNALQQKGIRSMDGDLVGSTGRLEPEILPGGWIWDDIGNYYGAGCSALNWHENQYDLILQSGPLLNQPVTIVDMKPKPVGVLLESRLRSAAKGSGDNAYIYLPPNASHGYVSGTIPVDEKAFTIAGSFPDPPLQLLTCLKEQLNLSGIKPYHVVFSNENLSQFLHNTASLQQLATYYSPSFDSLNYWFLKKSINLYGEAFIKTMAVEKTGTGSTEKGVELVKAFWKEQGIEPSALHIIDGSGLSPQNRVTTDAMVKVLQFARSRPWFHYFYDALPVFNQMKLKSGTIGGSKSFAGYHTSKDGTTYSVAIIVNNFDGSAAGVVKKMYAVLDELK